MKAVYNDTRENAEIECEKVQEGDTGLYLYDAYDNQIGYIPYSTLIKVVPSE